MFKTSFEQLTVLNVEIFAEEGTCVLIAARREDDGRELADMLGDKVDFLKTDVSLETDVERMIRCAVDRFGKLDCLFNNAGVPATHASIAEIPLKDYQYALSVLLGGVFLGMKHATPVMWAQRSGSIINTGSIAGILAGYSSIIYSTAEAAVIHLTKLVAMELGESNVRVNCISPGGIATGIFGKAAGLPTDQAEKTVEVMKQVLVDIQPIRRAGIVDDIAQAAVFLASDESTFINGHNLVVDGGLTGGRLWSAQQKD
ncbi:MAG: SDR family oxidoreductase [Desulfobacterales bacterium]|jgi:NAD(P)-dependent dehydrogenase (short-subunit alcohol dehydrogenase family)